ncbi:gliding motility lipoprotein GldH [Flavobacterium sp.]|uniref:gliding motility lipoprotein GldH n=1 Tax=Flavobacterium sp. TaxID=239 RepID=UPI003750AA1B
MRKTIRTNSFLAFGIALMLISCDKTQIFDEYHTFQNGWDKKNSVIFTFDQEVSKKPNNIFINIRSNNDYEFNNLFLITKLEQPSGLIKVDTLEYEMADLDGNMLGEGFSDIKESKLWYKENVKFPEKGKYKISISQAVRKTGKVKGVEKLKGITEIGFRIETSQVE